MWETKVILLVLMVPLMEAKPQQAGESLLVTSSSTAVPNAADSVPSVPEVDAKPKVYELKVRTDIRSRYARTLVTSRVVNPANKAQEVTFNVVIPENAFVSKFVMEVNGEIMEGKVKERSEAKQEYHSAVQSGQTAGHVATLSVRDSSNVQISVNVEPLQKATFNLTYEELLVRRKERYELAVNLNPGQVVRQMSVDVYIEEMNNITKLQVPSFRSSNEIDFEETETVNDEAQIEWQRGEKRAHVRFAPDTDSQRRLAKLVGLEEKGIGGQFIVRYDVEREQGPGEILALDGYFVHFFSPPALASLPKHAIFVLDVSGSMHGRKMEQLKEAMVSILGELKPGDYFNLIEFSDSINVTDLETPENSTLMSLGYRWRGSGNVLKGIEYTEFPAQVKSFPANEEYIAKARSVVRDMDIQGGTNINDALKAALKVAKRGVSYDGSDSKLPDPLIIFLTDGEATVGETNSDRIVSLIAEQSSSVPVFSLAFGEDADFNFLKRISIRSDAFARKIYEASDAALQLRDFYRQIASPLLSNVTFRYLDSQVDGSSVTKQKFSLLFSGSELVVAGKLRDDNAQNVQLDGEIQAMSQTGDARFVLRPRIDEVLPLPGIPEPRPIQPGDHFLERLWAFLSIRQELEKYDAERSDTEEGSSAKNKSIELALRYSFVTPVTSLVVVKSDNSSQETNSTLLTSDAAAAPGFQNYQGASYGNRLSAHHAYSNKLAGLTGGSYNIRQPVVQSAPDLSGGSFAGGVGYADTSLLSADFDSYSLPESAAFDPPAPLPTSTTRIPPPPSPPTTTPRPLMNLTRITVETLNWLHSEENGTSTDEWQTVRLGSDTYKLIRANKSELAGDAAECTPPHIIATSTTWKCLPLLDCVLVAFENDSQIFTDNFKCSIGTEGYLGACCPVSSPTEVTASTSNNSPPTA